MSVKKKKVLFVSYGGGHVAALYPVYKQLMNKDGIEAVFLALTTAALKFQQQDETYIGFKDLYQYADPGAAEYGRTLVGTPDENALVSYEESVAYMGISYACMVAELGEEGARLRFEREGGRQCFHPQAFFERLLADRKPDLVVATNSPRSERAAIDAACKLGIPALCLIDLFALQEIKWIGQPGYATRLCVLSDHIKTNLLTSGRDESEVAVTGNPAFDALAYVNSDLHRAEFRERKCWKADEKVVLWASNVEPDLHPFTEVKGDSALPENIEHVLQQGVAEDGDWRLVIRPHPNDPRVPELNTSGVELSPATESLEDLLAAVDCVVVMSSTVGLQAALLGKPLVNVKMSIFSADAPYDEMGMAVGVESLDALLPAVRQALQDGQTASGLPEVGAATANVTREICSMLEVE